MLCAAVLAAAAHADLLPRPDIDGGDGSGSHHQHHHALPPAWVTGDIEPPAGEKNMGTWVSAVYTPEQQKRLGVDENGQKVETNEGASNLLASRDEEVLAERQRSSGKPALAIFLPVMVVVGFVAGAMLWMNARGQASAQTMDPSAPVTPHQC